MKTIIFALCCLMLSAVPVRADEWTELDTGLQVTYTALHVVDWLQTLDMVHNPVRYDTVTQNGVEYHPTSYERTESNIILGRHPSEGTVHAYFASTLIAHAVVSYLLPKPYRELWQGLGIGVEGAVVAHNFQIGLNARF